MPLWNVYHPAGAYSEQEKREFAEHVTDVYTTVGLPAFYVVALFQEVDQGSFYVGGKPVTDRVRVAIDNIAGHPVDPATRDALRRRVGAVIQPFAAGKGLGWEFHIDETPNDLWMIDGFVPPPRGSAAEKTWATENRPIPY